MLQRDTTGLTSENRELKLRLQAMEQQAHLRDGITLSLSDCLLNFFKMLCSSLIQILATIKASKPVCID